MAKVHRFLVFFVRFCERMKKKKTNAKKIASSGLHGLNVSNWLLTKKEAERSNQWKLTFILVCAWDTSIYILFPILS